MASEQELQKLEQLVENLLGRFQALKREKNELAALVAAKDKRIEELDSQLDSLGSERTQVQDRVSTLLSSIEEWEKNLDGDDAPEALEESAASDDDAEPEAETESEESEESNSGATAGQLFSMGE